MQSKLLRLSSPAPFIIMSWLYIVCMLPEGEGGLTSEGGGEAGSCLVGQPSNEEGEGRILPVGRNKTKRPLSFQASGKFRLLGTNEAIFAQIVVFFLFFWGGGLAWRSAWWTGSDEAFGDEDYCISGWVVRRNSEVPDLYWVDVNLYKSYIELIYWIECF